MKRLRAILAEDLDRGSLMRCLSSRRFFQACNELLDRHVPTEKVWVGTWPFVLRKLQWQQGQDL